MKLNDVLNETPIAGYETLSDTPKSPRDDPSEISKSPEDFEKRSSSYTDKRDRRLLTNPIPVKRMKNLFNKTSVDFYFYMVNTKDAREHTEIGEVTREWLKENMPGVEPHIKDHYDGITIIFTNNKGDQKIPMTPWIMAHRIGHAFSRKYSPIRGASGLGYYREAEQLINDATKRILEYDYGYHIDSGFPIVNRKSEMIRRKFFEAIGTFRSARKKMLRQDFEFINELFAQYLITGGIKFNPVPDVIKIPSIPKQFSGFGLRIKGDKQKQEANEELSMLARDLEQYSFDGLLGEVIDRIFVM